MSRTIAIDDSEPGSWRGTLALREPGARTSCAACGQTFCEHSDAVWGGLALPPGSRR